MALQLEQAERTSAALATPTAFSCCLVAPAAALLTLAMCTQPFSAAPLARSARRDGDFTPAQRSERDAIFDATERAHQLLLTAH